MYTKNSVTITKYTKKRLQIKAILLNYFYVNNQLLCVPARITAICISCKELNPPPPTSTLFDEVQKKVCNSFEASIYVIGYTWFGCIPNPHTI